MMVAVNANARTTVAAASEPPSKLTAAFNVAFRAGAVMGYALCAMGLATLLRPSACWQRRGVELVSRTRTAFSVRKL